MSFFECNIRFLGGFLSVYQLTGDTLYLEKAESVARVLKYAFGSEKHQAENHGIPLARLNLRQGFGINFEWDYFCSILAEFGTLSLEWATLAAETNNMSYLKYVTNLTDHLMQMGSPEDGVWKHTYRSDNLKSCTKEASFGGRADSFYEYMVKFYLLTGRNDNRQLKWVHQTTTALKESKTSIILRQNNPHMPVMMVEHDRNGQIVKRMGHLACFAGGFWALTSELIDKEDNLEIAKGVTQSCRSSYIKSATQIGPEYFDNFGYSDGIFGQFNFPREYHLRPETIESYFYLYRFTKDQKYRQWAWEFVEALEKHCRVEFGYAGLVDVNHQAETIGPTTNYGVQNSYFLAETLKYESYLLQ